ncbi:MFS transporter [Streptomyces antimicrobicus]|uniref:MFS transporter n=1 Tax=Streptomyces antimicrobicus TaxID=2883108 RepID=A0ABS8B7R7_9ACTN|nr:MFS transporter [Streptomyces antimicrobicus]MCB5180663.1 MFS transporter [Streptomyces antimicrobicus]
MSSSFEKQDVARSPDTAARPLRKLRGFQFFFLSRVISGLGSAVTTVVLPVLTYERTGSPLLVSLVAAAGTLPYLLFGLVAGAVADRVDRRRLMVAADLLNAAVLATVPLAAALGVLTGAQVIAVALVSSSLALFFDAGVYGFVPETVGKEHLAQANSLIYGAESIVRITGTALAGALMVLVRPAGALVLDAVSFIASALLLRAVARRPREAAPAAPRPGFKESVGEGLRFLRGHPVLRTLTVVGTLQSFAGGAIVGQLVVYADRGLGIHGTDARIGFLYAAWSAGGISGSLLVPRLRRRLEAFRILLLILPLGALLGVVVVLSSTWWVAVGALALWGSAYLVVLVNTMTYSQEVTPAELQGRVNTTRRMLASGLGVPLGALVASATTVHFGIRAGMSAAVVSLALAAVLVWTVHLRQR